MVLQLPTYKTKERVKSTPPSQVDIAIVGTGLGSLTAGAFLARRGWRVACFDSHYVAGGCATQFSRGSGEHRFLFDIGLHYIGSCYKGGKISSLLEALDIQIDFAQMDPNGFDVINFPDFTFEIPSNRDLYRERLVSMFPKEKRGIDKYLKFVKQVDDIIVRTEKTEGKMTLKLIWRIFFKGRKVLRYQNSTLEQLLDDCTQNPQLRAVLTAQHGDYALPPSQVSAVLHAGMVNHYLRGAYYPKEGGQVIADKIADTIEANGGTIHLRQTVSEIMIEKGQATGIRVRSHGGDEREVKAKIVLSGADLIQTCKRLIGMEHLPSSWQGKLHSWTMAKALFSMYLGVECDLRDYGMKNANYWKFDDYDTEGMYQRMEEKELVSPSASYTTSASLKALGSTEHAPSGHQTLEIMTMVSGDFGHWGVSKEEMDQGSYRHKENYLEAKRMVEQKLFVHLDEQFPGVRDKIVFCESATPVTHSRYTHATAGTSYGLAATPEQFMKNRPDYKMPVKHLYICGSSSRAGHGIIGAMTSGHEAASEIARKLKQPLVSLH